MESGLTTVPNNISRRVPKSTRGSARTGQVASPFPFVLGLLAVAVSVVLAVITALNVTSIPLSGDFAIPLAHSSTVALSIAGYVLTPLTVIGALAWDRVAQRKGLQSNRNFGLKPQYSLWLQVLTMAAFVFAIWHILNIASWLAGGA
jgi:hypothetical protein